LGCLAGLLINWFWWVDGVRSGKDSIVLYYGTIGRFMGVTTLIGMRPLFHPSIEDVTVEGILHALSDPVRVAMYADIVAQECPRNCSNFLTVSNKAIPKSTLSQHFKILREAGLIRSERHGVEMQNISRCTELEKRFPGLIQAIVTAHSIQLADKARAKMPARKRPARRAAGK
jgi:DNA-binding transcriptional ArsR family regulator